MEEIYGIIGANFPYTYIQFLEQVTPKLASKLLDIVGIRENNDYWYAASLHGVDIKDKIIKPRVETEVQEISEEQRKATKKYLADWTKRRQNVEG